jgi:hypothetical protein
MQAWDSPGSYVQFTEGMNSVLQLVSTVAVSLRGGLPMLIGVEYRLKNITSQSSSSSSLLPLGKLRRRSFLEMPAKKVS